MLRFTFVGKFLPALKSTICLKEKHADHPKTVTSQVKLFKKWLSMTDEEKLAACGGDQRILSTVAGEITAMGCPATDADLVGWLSANRVAAGGSQPLEEHHEFVKANMRVLDVAATAEWGTQAVQALTDNS